MKQNKDTMHVAMYYNNHDVRLEEMPKPDIGPDELLVKVKASGICGSDVMEWYRIKKAPLVLGHEIAGEIVEVGKDIKKYKVGDRVFVAHHVPCNECRYCLNGYHTSCETLHTTNFYPGGFSEYIRIPALNVDRGTFVLPEEMSFEEATFIEPLACVVRAQRTAQLRSGQHVLILGSGISGLLHILLARTWGAGRIIATDVNKNRLETARKFGADIVLDATADIAERLRRENNDRLADLVIVCTTAVAAFHQALRCVDRGATILCFAPTPTGEALPIPVNDFWRKEIKIVHSYGSAPYDDEEAIELISSKKVRVREMITHRLTLPEAGLGFKLTQEGKNSLKVIIEPHRV